jgi:Zn-finger nucleic acid-binding protein
MSDRNGVEIDYCPSCRGVWLDRGELDKIIERAGSSAESHSEERQHERHEEQRRNHDHDEDYDRHPSHHNKKHKKENFLGDLFDF